MIPLSYNLRSLTVRKTTTFATAFGIALVVFVFSAVSMLSAGIKKTLGSSGKPDNAIITRKGSDAELSSAIDTPNIGLILAPKEVARRKNGQSDGVGEVVVVATADKVDGNGVSNAQIRGVPEDVYEFRPEAKIIEGRKAKPGADEAVIGKAIAGRFKGFGLGQSYELRKNRPVQIVGVFETGGSSFESELWADVDTVRTAYGRDGIVSSVRVRLSDPGLFPAYERAIEGNRQLGFEVEREVAYYEKQSEGTSLFINILGTVVAFFFAIGAMVGAMITMYSAVANRKREIGTLRALGFGKGQILFSFLFEALVLSLIGGAIGAAAALAMSLVSFSMMNFQSFSEIVFRFEPTPDTIISALIFAGVMGFIGGFAPAVRAARMPLIKALKE
ncbi:MAG TPA: ABC transporter permease [Polyangiales bacterium]|nr:ABC transporter permease [Polyangiales bacterium]